VTFEKDMLYETMSAFENLYYWARLYGLQKREARDRAKELLDAASLTERGNDRVETLSRGMKRRLAFVRALLHRPRLLLLDEPVAGLDFESRIAFRNLVTELVRTSDVAVLIASHDLRELEKLCTQVALIKQGRIILSEAVSALAEGSRRRFFVECSGVDSGIRAQIESVSGVQTVRPLEGGIDVELAKISALGPLLEKLEDLNVKVGRVAKWGTDLERLYLEHFRRSGEDGGSA
jgi:ABC-2 type transport system ATP-binding protein